MIPVDTLRRDPAIPKADNDNEIDFDRPPCRRETRQEPLHRHLVSKRRMQLINELLVADNTIRHLHLLFRGPARNEHITVERPQLVLAPTPGVHRHMVDDSVVGHRFQRGFDILGGELTVEMLTPQLLHLHLIHREPPRTSRHRKSRRPPLLTHGSNSSTHAISASEYERARVRSTFVMVGVATF